MNTIKGRRISAEFAKDALVEYKRNFVNTFSRRLYFGILQCALIPHRPPFHALLVTREHNSSQRSHPARHSMNSTGDFSTVCMGPPFRHTDVRSCYCCRRPVLMSTSYLRASAAIQKRSAYRQRLE